MLEVGAFPGEIVLIDDPAMIPDAVTELKKSNIVGFDTETRPAFKKGVFHKVSLLQLATPDIAFLLRLNMLGLPMAIREILEDPKTVKVGAAVRDDLKALRVLAADFTPFSFFDLNEELKRVGFHNVGVRNLSAMVLNIRISKSEQVSNWEDKNLTRKQQLYAATDAWACLEVFLTLREQGYLDPLLSNPPE